ncbi:hypothetical protein EYF80_021198 [Liparis tanakae]|uniref:Secreted protein n=1 Tax=Liparis tanakae TaxID=230148 RepID=A0A4Z2HUH1_9TELE|nr:hypothetical protein EYF80_021198 [Liparis tanakae]
MARSWYISFRLWRHLVMFSLLILASNVDRRSSQRWWAQCTWKRVHFSISDTVRGQHRCCWVMSCQREKKRRTSVRRVATATKTWEAGRYLADGAGPVPDQVVPVPVVVVALVQDLSHQVVHGHAEHRQGAQLMGQGLLLVRRGATVFLDGRRVIHLVGGQQRSFSGHMSGHVPTNTLDRSRSVLLGRPVGMDDTLGNQRMHSDRREAELVLGGLRRQAEEVEEGGGHRALRALGLRVKLQRLCDRRLLHRRTDTYEETVATVTLKEGFVPV